MKFLIEDCVFLELKEGYIKVREILFLWYGKLYLVVRLFIEKMVMKLKYLMLMNC